MRFTYLVWGDVLAHVRDLSIAYLLALPVGWDRERAVRNAGIRTFPLIAIASCGYVLLAAKIVGGVPADQARILQGFIAGIGFLAGGAVLKEVVQGGGVVGMTTAASLWTTGIGGAAVGYGLYDIALVLAVINFLTLRFLRPFKRHLDEERAERRGTLQHDMQQHDMQPTASGEHK